MYNVSEGSTIFNNNNNYIYGKLISMIYNNSTLDGKVSKIVLYNRIDVS